MHHLTLSMGFIAALQLFANLGIQLLVLAIVGAGESTDAYIAAQTIPLLLFAVISTSLQSVWQPRLSVVSNAHAVWHEELQSAQAQAARIFAVPAVLLAASVSIWVPVLFPGFSNEQAQLILAMSWPLFIAAALNTHAALATTAQRARGRFIGAELVSLAATLIALAAVAAYTPRHGVIIAAWALLARSVVVAVALHVLTNTPKLSMRRSSGSTVAWRQARPLLAGASLYKSGPLVDRFWSAQAGPGGVTLYNLALTAMGALAAILERAVCAPVTPSLAKLQADGQWTQFRSLYRKTLLRATLPTALLAAVFFALLPVWSGFVGALLKINESSANQLWAICILLTGYFYVASAGTVVNAAFYALGDTRTPVNVGIIAFILSLALKAAGFLLAGLYGLALAATIHYAGSLAVMFAILERKLNAQLDS